NRGVLSAGLFAGVEPGGVFEQRHEGHAQRSQPATRPANIAGPVVGIHETLDSGAGTCDKLLSASVDSICGSRGIGLIFLRAGVIPVSDFGPHQQLARFANTLFPDGQRWTERPAIRSRSLPTG